MTHKTLYLLMTAAFISFTGTPYMASAQEAAPAAVSGAASATTSTQAASGSASATAAKSSSSIAQSLSNTAVGRGLSQAADSANTVTQIGRGVETISNTNLSAGSVKSGAQAADQITGGMDKLLGTNTANSIKDTTSTITQGAGDFDTAVNGFNSIANTGLSTDSINSAAKGLDSISSTFDKWAGTQTGKDLGKLTGEVSKITGDIDKSMASINSITSDFENLLAQGQSVKDLINDPQAMLQAAFGMVNYQTLANALADYAIEEAFNYIEPSTGWPVSSQEMKTQKGLEKAEKTANAELDDKIRDEKQKQLDAVGGRPETPAPTQTGVNKQPAPEGAETNPAADDCRAYMAQYPDATHNAFDYVNENLFKQSKKDKFGPAQNDYNSAVEYVKKNFYYEDPQKITPEIQKKLTKARLDYLQELNTNLMSIGMGVQSALLEDAKSISNAPTSGCNFIDDMNVNSKTFSTIIRQTMAELAIQVRLFELEAVKEQATQPVGLLPNPDEKTQEGQ